MKTTHRLYCKLTITTITTIATLTFSRVSLAGGPNNDFAEQGCVEILFHLSPSSVAASGLNDATFRMVYQRVRQRLNSREHNNAISELATARQALRITQYEIRRSGISEIRRAKLDFAEAALVEAEIRWQSVQDDINENVMDVVTELAGSETANLMARVSENQDRAIPAAYRVLDLNDTAWSLLEAALRNERRGVTCTNAELAALNAARSSTAVALAETRLAANLPALKAAWQAQANALLDENVE
ncbi:MAG: hypothetical protein H6814_09160 [Phycisphaeraceae bacterium]|nr:hypothetical protein [Phycisphaeraceae bacterium]